MAEAVFEYSHRVTYSDCTLGDHVYHSRYLDILEAARGEFFRSRGVPLKEWQDRDVVLPVIECSLRYKAMARYDDVVKVSITVSLAQGTRLNLEYTVCNARSELILLAQTCHACVSVAGKVKRLPLEFLQLMDQPAKSPAAAAH